MMISEPNFSANESEFVYEACTAVAEEALDDGRTVILDATFGSSRRRATTLSSLEGHYSRADIVHVVCDLETAMERNSVRPGPSRVPEENLRGIASGFEVPESAITVNTSEITPEAAAKLVAGALFNPVAPSGRESQF
jgi:predicted kinase